MKPPTAAVLLLALTLLPTACIWQQQKVETPAEPAAAEAKPQVLPPLYLGAVHQVYPEQGFALLRIIGPLPKAGDTLISHPADGSTGRMGNLCVSALMPARNGIVAADIRSGTIAKGDRVFRYRNIASGAASDDVIAVERPAGMVEDMPPATSDTPLPAPAPIEEEEAPIPPPTASPTVETTVLPTFAPVAPGSDPDAPKAPAFAPDYLDSIPDSIDDWN